ncbi:MAG: hypothetical protein ABR609_06630, partial [Acidimicrobiia bacterium]
LRALLVLVAAGALAFMQPFPVAAFLANGFAIYGLIAVGSPSDLYQWTNLLALVLMAARTPLRRSVLPLLLGLLGVALYFWRFTDEGGIPTMLIVQSLYVSGFLGGTSQRTRLRSSSSNANATWQKRAWSPAKRMPSSQPRPAWWRANSMTSWGTR